MINTKKMNNQNYTYMKLKLENLDSNKFYTFYRKMELYSMEYLTA